jgi:regulator of protease activity HflC (stomatin/prohibitin superfamily)
MSSIVSKGSEPKRDEFVAEKEYKAKSGWKMMPYIIGAFLAAPVFAIIEGLFRNGQVSPFSVFLGMAVALAAFICLFGFMAIAPNDSRVLLLFGDYQGTVKKTGFYWVNPFFNKKKVSLRVRNFETGTTETPARKDAAGTVVSQKSRTASRPSKVNDRDGNPIEISAVVVWKVVDTAEALFEVDDYQDFVRVQSESALRNLATRHPYDSEDYEVSLRGNTSEIAEQLEHDIQERLHRAGVKVIEARISHLAYAQEIAAAMLQRQQASAVVAARSKIVEGAVGMVEMALNQLSEQSIVELDDERRAAMVSNLLVVLCSDRHTQPVINTGSLY